MSGDILNAIGFTFKNNWSTNLIGGNSPGGGPFVTANGATDPGPWQPWGGSSWALAYLAAIPTDPTKQATSRNIYRQFQDGVPALIGTLRDNTTTEYQHENY